MIFQVTPKIPKSLTETKFCLIFSVQCLAPFLFSVGISALELIVDVELPNNGVMWHQIREGHIPDTPGERVFLGATQAARHPLSNFSQARLKLPSASIYSHSKIVQQSTIVESQQTHELHSKRL